MTAEIPPLITHCERIIPNKLTIKGDVVRFSDVLQVKCPWKIKRIDILASDKILIDSSFTSDDDFQLNIVAPTWEVIKSQKIILDGKQGKLHKFSKAELGKTGLPGLPGGAGGNFFGIGINFINSRNLSISADGGEGGPGQDGGDGVRGARGKDVNLATIPEKPDTRRFFGMSVQEYMIEGGAGQNGGDGGDGGKGGLGGPSGEVWFLNVSADHRQNNPISISKKDGKDGADGKGGVAGSGGVSGHGCRVTISRNYVFWIEIDKKMTYSWLRRRVIAPSGRDGLKGFNGQDRSSRNIPEPFSDTLLLYEMYILEKNPKNRELVGLLGRQAKKLPEIVNNSLTKVRKKRGSEKNVNYEVVNDLRFDESRWKGLENSKDEKVRVPSLASFDLNSNLMLGELLVRKIFGTSFQSRSFLSPEQERLRKVRELEEQILPFLDRYYMP